MWDLMPYWGQLGFSDAGSSIILQLIQFHDYAIVILVMIITFVSFALISLITNRLVAKCYRESHLIETVWTLIPTGILLVLAFPSLRLLYVIDELYDPAITIKVIGRQWYWTYERGEFVRDSNTKISSFMLEERKLRGEKPFRMIEVDNRLILPCKTSIRVLVTSTDVIHSWAVPRLGIKMDAVPGRLNQTGLCIDIAGIYVGFCSEICGANHRFIPIVVEGIRPSDFVPLVYKIGG